MMTNKDAISWLNKIVEKYIHGGDEYYDEKEAINIAVSALELQEDLDGYKDQLPFRKPQLISTIYLKNGSTIHGCPWCQEELELGQNYCKECGQALDWGNFVDKKDDG